MELLEHNRITTEQTEKFISEGKDCCIVNPCGSGKTTIMVEVIKNHPESTFTLVTKQKNAKAYYQAKSDVFKKINIVTYSKLGQDYKKNIDMSVYDTDFLLLDEAHYMGATNWRKAIGTIKHKYHPIMLGFTATEKRYEHQGTTESIVTEFFNGNSTGNFTSKDLCAKGLFIEPEVIVSLSNIDEEISKRITNLELSDMKEENKEALVKTLTNIKKEWEIKASPSVIMHKYLPQYMYKENCNKILVYSPTIADIQANKELLDPILHNIFKDKEIVSYEYTQRTNESVFQEFLKEDNNYIKVLYSVDKIMETIHIEDLNIIIMLRPSVSDRIITQQYGRVNNIGSDKKALILDFVGNLDHLGSVTFEQMYYDHSKVSKRKEKNTSIYKINISYANTINSLFSYIDNQLNKYPIYTYRGYTGSINFLASVFDCDKQQLIEYLNKGYDIEDSIKYSHNDKPYALRQDIFDNIHDTEGEISLEPAEMEKITKIVDYFISKKKIKDEDTKQDLYLVAYTFCSRTNRIDTSRVNVQLNRAYTRWMRNQVRNEEIYTTLSNDIYTTDVDLSDTIESQVIYENLIEDISIVLSDLTEREYQVLIHRFGLDNSEPKTLAEVGQDLGVTGERVREIEVKALRKLRVPHRRRKLRPYMESLVNDSLDSFLVKDDYTYDIYALIEKHKGCIRKELEVENDSFNE